MRSILGGLVLFVAVVVFIGGCAPLTPPGPLHTTASYEDVFRAAAQSVVAAGYQVKSSDANTGVIAAERVYRQTRFKTDYLYLNVSVTKEQNGTLVTAEVQNPAGGFISTNVDYEKFVDALKKKLPDIKVVKTQ